MFQYTPEYGTMGFSYGKREAESIWVPVPENTEILVTHGPPFGILDVARRICESVGCPALAQTVLGRLSKLRLHVFGHIHEGRGAEVRVGAAGQDVVFVNAACRDLKHPIPVVVDLKNDTSDETNGDTHTDSLVDDIKALSITN
ncbi:hypothetical protein FRC08_012843 [Ceratobasidium sp. 394]|nr:hypothetical protein FRC08_012843 [Ceratobasidium sp. 394]